MKSCPKSNKSPNLVTLALKWKTFYELYEENHYIIAKQGKV